MDTKLRLDVSGQGDGDIPPPRTPEALPMSPAGGLSSARNGAPSGREDGKGWRNELGGFKYGQECSAGGSDHTADQAARSPPADAICEEPARWFGAPTGHLRAAGQSAGGSSASFSLFEEDTGLSSFAESTTGGDEWRSMSSRSAVLSANSGRSSYTTKSFHSSNVKEIFLEEWLNIAKAHVPSDPPSVQRRLGDSPAESGGEIIVIVDSIVQHQRRSPMLGVSWGDFPLFPVGDPQPLSPLRSRVAARYPVWASERDEEHINPRACTAPQDMVLEANSKRMHNQSVHALASSIACAGADGSNQPLRRTADVAPRTAGSHALQEADLVAALQPWGLAGSPGNESPSMATDAGQGRYEHAILEGAGEGYPRARATATLTSASCSSPLEVSPVSHHIEARDSCHDVDGGLVPEERVAEVSPLEDASDAWTAVLSLAEHIMGSHTSSTEAPFRDELISGAAALASTGDASDLAADVRRLEPHADGVWVVDDGMPLDAGRPPVTGEPAGLRQVLLECLFIERRVLIPAGGGGGLFGWQRMVSGPGQRIWRCCDGLCEWQMSQGSGQRDRPLQTLSESTSLHQGDGRQQQDKSEHDDKGWIYSGAFPLMHADSVLIPAPARSRPEPLDFVRWRRWIRRRQLRTVERRLVRVEASAEAPGDRVGDVDVRSVPSSSLAICNLSTHRIYVGVYLPLDGAHDGGNAMVLREGEVLGLGINAICRALDVKGRKCVLVAARCSSTLPPLLTADVTARLCVVVPESLFKRVYLSVADADEDGIRSLACARGEDGVVAFNNLQRELYLKAKPHALQRLQLHARARHQYRWEQDAAVHLEGLSAAERHFVRNRRRRIRADLSRMLAEDVAEDQVPCICLCMSGGGVRAMIYALGAVRALERMGVLPLVMYSASLSGSAWMQALWMSVVGRSEDSLESLAAWLSTVLEHHPISQAVTGSLAATLPHDKFPTCSAEYQTSSAASAVHSPARSAAASAAAQAGAGGLSAGASGALRAPQASGNETDRAPPPPPHDERSMDGGAVVDAVTEPFSRQANETLQRFDRQRAAAEAFATALHHRAAWSGKTASLVEIYGFLAANAWLPIEAAGVSHSEASSKEGLSAAGLDAQGQARLNEELLLKRLEMGLSQQAGLLAAADRPFPIYTAVSVKEAVGQDDEAGEGARAARAGESTLPQEDVVEDLLPVSDYEWYEWTPFDFSSCDTGKSIPSWALGREFQDGVSVSVCPEMPLAILFGVWGAAFTANATEVLRSLTGLGLKKQQLLATSTTDARMLNLELNKHVDSPRGGTGGGGAMSGSNRHVERFHWVMDTISMARALEAPLFNASFFSSQPSEYPPGSSADTAGPCGQQGRPNGGRHSKLAAQFQKFRFVEPFQCNNPFIGTPVRARQRPPATSMLGPPLQDEAAGGVGARVAGEERRRTSDGPSSSDDVDTRRSIKLTDAGVHFNLPFPAVLRPERRADLILCLDARSLAGPDDGDESVDALRPAARFAEAKGWPFPPLDPDTMHGVGLRPCSIFGMDEEEDEEKATVAEATSSAPTAATTTATPNCWPSGEQMFDKVTLAERREAAAAAGRQAAADACEKGASNHELPPSPPPPSPPQRPPAQSVPTDSAPSSAPILVYLPLVKNEEVDEDLEPLTTAWCDLFEFAYEVRSG